VTAIDGLTPGQHLERVAIEVSQIAAALVRGEVGRAAAAGTKSSPTDVVTETDLRSEALIRRELMARCPGSTIVGEELTDDVGTNTIGWIVDPIDGTVNFLYNLPVMSVSVAGEAVAADEKGVETGPTGSPQLIQLPPSTLRVCAVIYRASSDARNTHGSATSSGSPIRPKGTASPTSRFFRPSCLFSYSAN
jgi:fructose-1,6-bisphosphatase/inositol monophosphatase family enzyme